MLERLEHYWAARGDVYLPKLVAYLIALRREMVDAKLSGVEERSEVGDFVYPLF